MTPSGRAIGFDEWAMTMARSASLWSECASRQVGAVVVKNRRIIATGCNGSPPGGVTCLQGNCPRANAPKDQVPPLSSYDSGPGTCIAIHAEMNAIAQLATHAGGAQEATLYTTFEPCPGCWRLIRATGIDTVIYPGAGGELVVLERHYRDFKNAGKLI